MKKNFNEAINAVIWISIFIIPLFFLPITRDYFEINKMFLFYFLTLLLLGLWIFQIIFEKKIIIKKSSFWLPIIILLTIWVLSTFFSIHPYTSLFGNPWRFNGGLLSIISFLIFAFIAINTINIKEINFYLKAILSSALIVALIGILQNFQIITFIPNEARVGSTLGQANFLGSFILIGTFISIYFILITKNIWGKIIFIAIIYIPIFYCLILTASRSAWISAAVSAVFIMLILLIFNFKKQFLIVILISIISIFILIPSLKEKYRNINLRPEGTVYSRIYAWKGAIEITKNNPLLGTGPETFLYALPKYRDPKLNYNYENWTTRFDKAHNEYLNLLATTGILGLLSFLFILYKGFQTALRIVKQANDFKIKILIFSIIAGMISLLTAVSVGFFVVSTWLIFWFIIVILAVFENQIIWKNKNYIININLLNKINQSIILTLMTTLMVLAIFYLRNTYLAEIHFSHKNNSKAVELNPRIDIYMGTLAGEKQEPVLAQKAININPLNPDNWENYAQIETDWEKSKNALLYAENLDPSNAKLYYELGQKAFENGDLEFAKIQLQKALELKNDYQEVKDLLNQIVQ